MLGISFFTEFKLQSLTFFHRKARKNSFILRVSCYFIIFSPFEISGVYGDVQRVKILYNKKDSALVQMAEPAQANIGES